MCPSQGGSHRYNKPVQLNYTSQVLFTNVGITYGLPVAWHRQAQSALAFEAADRLPAPGADGGSSRALITDDINDEVTCLSSANKQM